MDKPLSEFEAALADHRKKPSVSAVMVSTMVKRSPGAEKEIMIVEVVGYCESEEAAKIYCDHENEVFRPSKGGVNPYSWKILHKLS